MLSHFMKNMQSHFENNGFEGLTGCACEQEKVSTNHQKLYQHPPTMDSEHDEQINRVFRTKIKTNRLMERPEVEKLLRILERQVRFAAEGFLLMN